MPLHISVISVISVFEKLMYRFDNVLLQSENIRVAVFLGKNDGCFKKNLYFCA